MRTPLRGLLLSLPAALAIAVAATDEGGGAATSMIPLARMAEPDEVSQLVAFLASDEARYITGAVMSVDAGASV